MTEIHGAGPLLGNAPHRAEELGEYLASGGYGPGPDPEELLALIAEAGVRGRGGAAFPLATKLRAVRGRPGGKVVVANGAEGEPGSVKDRQLMRARPHLVIDGLCRVAAIVGATTGYVYVADPVAAQQLRQALRDWWLPIAVGVVDAPHTYVAGEESAVVHCLNGGPALPVAKPPRPFERGVNDQPTLVSNVETLAQVALLAARRPAWDRMLVTVSGGQTGAALHEIPVNAPLRLLLGGQPIGGALAGGMFGRLLGPAEALDLPLSPGTVGCGAIHLLAPGESPLALAADVLSYLASESSRQCGVCVSGTRALADTVLAWADNEADESTADKLRRWSATLPGRGACGLLDAAARVAGSLLDLDPQPSIPYTPNVARLVVAPPVILEGAAA